MSKKPVPQPPPHFDEWKRCLFQRPPELCCIFDENVEDFIERDDEYEFRASPAELLALFTYTMRNLTAIVEDCSDRQIVFGLNYIFNGSYSNLCHDLIEAPEQPETRLDAIQSIYDHYFHFFALRCAPVLGHRNEIGSALDGSHYMIWDVSPLGSWVLVQDVKANSYPLLTVLERVLYLPHNGCIESALHGLGELVFYRKDDLIPSIIDRFLAATPGLRPELRKYALAARTGMIQ